MSTKRSLQWATNCAKRRQRCVDAGGARVDVLLTPEAHAALGEIQERHGLSMTGAINWLLTQPRKTSDTKIGHSNERQPR